MDYLSNQELKTNKQTKTLRINGSETTVSHKIKQNIFELKKQPGQRLKDVTKVQGTNLMKLDKSSHTVQTLEFYRKAKSHYHLGRGNILLIREQNIRMASHFSIILKSQARATEEAFLNPKWDLMPWSSMTAQKEMIRENHSRHLPVRCPRQPRRKHRVKPREEGNCGIKRTTDTNLTENQP